MCISAALNCPTYPDTRGGPVLAIIETKLREHAEVQQTRNLVSCDVLYGAKSVFLL